MALPENPSLNLTKEVDIRLNKINLLKENNHIVYLKQESLM